MTESGAGERDGKVRAGGAAPDAACAWCGRPLRQGRTGRPRQYCTGRCRQRAFTARERARAAGLSPDEVVVTHAAVRHLQDRLWVLRCALEDANAVAGDTAATAAELRAALHGLRDALGDTDPLWLEPADG